MSPNLRALSVAFDMEREAILLPRGKLQRAIITLSAEFRALGFEGYPEKVRNILEQTGDIVGMIVMISSGYRDGMEDGHLIDQIINHAKEIRASRLCE